MESLHLALVMPPLGVALIWCSEGDDRYIP